MILLSKQHHPGFTEFAPAIVKTNGFLPGFPPVCGKPGQLESDGARLTQDGAILLSAPIERRPGSAEPLAGASRSGIVCLLQVVGAED